MNRIKEFFNEHFGSVRTIVIDDVTYFFGVDIARALGYSNESKAISTHCKKTRKETLETSNSQNGRVVKSQVLLITKSDIYRLIVRSKLESSDEFEAWVFEEILPQIEGTGGYIETDREAEFIDKYFPSFTEETKLSMVQDLRKQNKEYKEKIADLEPKAQAYADLMTAQGYLKFLDIAALVDTGRNTLLKFLRKCKVLTKQSNYNIPYGRFLKNGMFKVVTSRSENGHISSVTMVSPKGLHYIYKLMKKKDVLDEFNTTALLQKIKELEVA